MNNNRNTALNTNANERQKDDSNGKFQCISKLINSLSILCSLVGISLFSAVFFGLTNILDYRYTKNIVDCAHYLVITAIILYCFALLLTPFKQNSKQNSSITFQRNVNSKLLIHNSRTANVRAESSKLVAAKLKVTKCNNEVKQSTLTESFRPLNLSTATVQDSKVAKQVGIGSKASRCKTESLKSTEKLALVAKQPIPLIKEREIPVNKQIVPAVLSPRVEHHHENSINKQIVPATISSRATNFWNVMSASTSANNSAAEIVCTRKLTFIPGGIVQCQEEVRRTTFFRRSEGGISSPAKMFSKFHPGSVETFRVPSSMFNKPHKNKVSDVSSKFETLNIYH